eukprot:3754630-Ditylum_brightwellii.AAC.1
MKEVSMLEQGGEEAGDENGKKKSGGGEKDTNKKYVPPMAHASLVSMEEEYDSDVPIAEAVSQKEKKKTYKVIKGSSQVYSPSTLYVCLPCTCTPSPLEDVGVL